MTFETRSTHACFNGVQGYYEHASASTGTAMRFSVFQPPQARAGRVPVLFYLAGLTCTEETFMIKAGAQRVAAELGLMLVTCDTSPRGIELPGDRDSWDFGVGAGFYVDATESPWSAHYRMETYVTQELHDLILAHFPADPARIGIFGHSMGGHGALTLALRHPDRYRSVSAFAPIAAPSDCPWGEKAFNGYLGSDRARWISHDACALIAAGRRCPPLRVDQGLSDQFLSQLHTDRLEKVCREAGQPLTLHRHDGYDHGYYFISTFMEAHLRHHAVQLA